MSDQSKPDVSVVIPNIDGGDILSDCLTSLLSAEAHLEVILVDNGSTDASVAIARAVMPDIAVIANETNRGFATGCNQGAALARGDFVMFLNNDASVGPGTVDALLARARLDMAQGGCIWQPPIVSPDGEFWDSAGSLFTPTGFLSHHPGGQRVIAAPQADHRIFSAKGACILVDRAAFDMVGGFDDSFFAYFEETDLCWRLSLRGRTTHFVDVPAVQHLGGVTARLVFTDEHLDFMFFRNRLVTILSLCGSRRLRRLLPSHLLAVVALAGAAAVLGRMGRAKGILRALAWTVRNRGLIRARRREEQRARTVPDSVVIDEVMVPMGLFRLALGGLQYLRNRPKTRKSTLRHDEARGNEAGKRRIEG